MLCVFWDKRTERRKQESKAGSKEEREGGKEKEKQAIQGGSEVRCRDHLFVA